MKIDVTENLDIVGMALNDYEANNSSNEESFFEDAEILEPGFNETVGLSENESSFMRDELLEETKELIKWGAIWFDDSAKNNGLSGLCGIQPERFSKVAFLVAKKRIPTSWLENSPEYTLGLMTLKILSVNAIELQKLKNQKSKKDHKEDE